MGVRINIEDAISGWVNLCLSNIFGWRSESTPRGNLIQPIVSISDPLVAGDTFTITINGIVLSTAFITSHLVTMQAIVTSINNTSSITALGVTATLGANQQVIYLTVTQMGLLITTNISSSGAGIAIANIVPVIWFHQNGVIPNSSYVSLHSSSFAEKALKWKSGVTNTDPNAPGYDPAYPNGKQTIAWPMEMVVTIKAYGQYSDDYLMFLQTSLDMEQIQEYLDVNGLSAIITMPPKDITIMIDEQAEPRMAMDITFRSTLSITDGDAGFITHVDFSGSFLGSLTSHNISTEE